MSALTFSELRSWMFRHYTSGEYEQALNIVTRHADEFPERAARIALWRVCLTSRLNDTPAALRLLGEALAAGHWWAEDWLRLDEDLKPLQGLPEFEQAVEVCRRRQVEAQAHAAPELVTYMPESGRWPYPTLIALHARADNARDAAEHWRAAVSQGWLLGLPQSSQILDPNAYSWDDVVKAEREISTQFGKLCEQHPVDRARVIVSGSSQGAALAIGLTVSGLIRSRGFIAVAPSLRWVGNLAPMLGAAQLSGLRGYVVSGEQDPRHAEAEELVDLLKAHGIACELESQPDLGHDFPIEFGRSLTNALAYVLRGPAITAPSTQRRAF